MCRERKQIQRVHTIQEYSGSFTIEAVFVLPMILFLLIAIIEVSFYLHDTCVVNACMNETLSQIASVARKDSKIQIHKIVLGIPMGISEEEQIRDIMGKRLERKLKICTFESARLKLDHSEISMEVTLKFFRVYQFLLPYIKGNQVQMYHSVCMYDPATSIRYERLIVDEFRRTKAAEKLKELLEAAADYLT